MGSHAEPAFSKLEPLNLSRCPVPPSQHTPLPKADQFFQREKSAFLPGKHPLSHRWHWEGAGEEASFRPLHRHLHYNSVLLLQEGGPFPGPESGLLSNTRKGTVRGDTRADKARDFIGKGRPGGEQEGEGPQEDGSATWLAVSGFMVMG